ncbi:mechanosensitive ion channel domain-containing protein [Flavobacterium chuncheonense]|uniref:Mechanosensitive ion channel domain-containing protein n=1 Tax=Flavobacterium chuncheonense TaxID=2026653 RepID=A0ABW5YLF6_9FLAO
MRCLLIKTIATVTFLVCNASFAQNDSINSQSDSINLAVLKEYKEKSIKDEKQRVADSLQKSELERQLLQLKTTDNLQKSELLDELKKIEEQEQKRIDAKKAHIDAMRNSAKGFPVIGILNDTLFTIYSKIGASSAKERATNINKKIKILYDDDFFQADSIQTVKSENDIDIVYHEMILMSISENDAIWYNETIEEVAENFKTTLKTSIVNAKKENSLLKTLSRLGLVVLVLVLAWLFIWLIRKGYAKLLDYIALKKEDWLKDLSIKDYTFLTADQEMKVIGTTVNALRWLTYATLFYITLPIVFSIFPFSRNWANTLFELIWSPFKSLLLAVWHYLPNLFSILVIVVVMKYLIRFVRYVFKEIESKKLTINGFHPDWAMPTFSIVKFLLYAFMLVLIFPYLPGSDSNIFKGVSVFIGVLFSLGSSSAIANMVAGLVITYMRPFKIGDRIKIGDVSGDIVEKNLLVTRVKTVKNEIVTIPNSSVLTGNTTNYSIEAADKGLIVHTTITLGYDIPWRDVHEALIEAALKTDMILQDPKPFVYQTSLDDFYVSYQINAYTNEASRQGLIYSNLHQNIQDVCNEKGIEILSPHYRAARDGNMTTIPAQYLPKDYKAPDFNINIKKPS